MGSTGKGNWQGKETGRVRRREKGRGRVVSKELRGTDGWFNVPNLEALFIFVDRSEYTYACGTPRDLRERLGLCVNDYHLEGENQLIRVRG